MNQFLDSLKALGPARLGILGATAAATIGFIVFLVTRVNAPGMALLYSDLEVEDSGRIVGRLDTMGVPYQLRGDGTQIFVPADRALNLRVTLAQDGLPNTGSVGYEVFDKSGALGASSFVNDINRVRALEGELARTIKTIGAVRSARVHLVLPRRELFSRERQEPSASIALRLRGGDQLGPAQVRAIQSLVAAAVPGLAPGRVSIIDHNGNLLARGSNDAKSGDAGAGQSDELRRSYEQRVARSVEELVGRSIGHGRVRVEVSADLDFDRMTTTSESFDPDGQVVRSTQTTQEQTDSKDASSAGGSVTVGENLPNAENQKVSGGPGANSNTTARSEEVVNFEISKTVKSHVREGASLKRLSVAVLVDGKHIEGADGQKTYQPQDAQTLEQIATLVRSAIGFDAKRGDTVEVVNMKFVEPDEIAGAEPSFFDKFDASSYIRLAETLILLLVGMAAMMFVVRPVLRRVFSVVPAGAAVAGVLGAAGTAAAPALTGPGGVPQLAGAAGVAQLAGPPIQGAALSGPTLAGQAALAAPDASGLLTSPAPALGSDGEMVAVEAEETINISNIEGRVKASTVRKIGDLVSAHPSETAAILRNWMVEQS